MMVANYEVLRSVVCLEGDIAVPSHLQLVNEVQTGAAVIVMTMVVLARKEDHERRLLFLV
jgi:hypothetical protein